MAYDKPPLNKKNQKLRGDPWIKIGSLGTQVPLGTGSHGTQSHWALYEIGHWVARHSVARHLVAVPMSGETNSDGWEASDNDMNSGKGYYWSCCVEMDIWESNSVANAYTPHPCETVGAYRQGVFFFYRFLR